MKLLWSPMLKQSWSWYKAHFGSLSCDSARHIFCAQTPEHNASKKARLSLERYEKKREKLAQKIKSVPSGRLVFIDESGVDSYIDLVWHKKRQGMWTKSRLETRGNESWMKWISAKHTEGLLIFSPRVKISLPKPLMQSVDSIRCGVKNVDALSSYTAVPTSKEIS